MIMTGELTSDPRELLATHTNYILDEKYMRTLLSVLKAI